jgi:hypothetical protein
MIPRAGVVIYHSFAFFPFLYLFNAKIFFRISLVTLFSKTLGLSTLYIQHPIQYPTSTFNTLPPALVINRLFGTKIPVTKWFFVVEPKTHLLHMLIARCKNFEHFFSAAYICYYQMRLCCIWSRKAESSPVGPKCLNFRLILNIYSLFSDFRTFAVRFRIFGYFLYLSCDCWTVGR